jgi:GDP-4-dehydro-6-deoxy-D-mannose reductase
MAQSVLITGVGGFVGRYMCDYLNCLQPRPNIVGVDVGDAPCASCDSFYKVDLSSVNDVKELIKRSKPDFIIHLAGIFGTGCYDEIYNANVLSIAALLESACQYSPDVVMVAAGSAAEYGRIEPQQLPVNEEALCQPITPYGLSKHLATQIAMYYHRVHSINVMIVRPFQLIGKGLSPQLAPGAFAEQLKQAIAKGSKVIKVGNLESSRDFLDINDAVEAIWTLCQKPAPGQIFNFCSGKPTKIAVLLDMMIASCGVDIQVEVDPARLRGRADVTTVYGSCEKLKKHCGWQWHTPLEKSVAAMFTD